MGLEILIIAILIAAACSVLGSFLMLKNMAMISDAISHTVLLGIVIGFFAVHNLNSPILIIGAGMTGILTVYLVEVLNSTKLMKEDSAIGAVFPFLFSIAVILISKFAGNVHLDIDSVLLGEIVFAPFNRMKILGLSVPVGLVSGLAVFIVNSLFIFIFFKELKISTFDCELAKTLGMKPKLIHYLLILLTSITSVVSFNVVGSILVVSFMIGPPVIAYLLTNKLRNMIIISVAIGAVASIIGYFLAIIADVSIAGTIAVVIGVIFLVVLLKKQMETYFQKRIKM
ncbi:metal ABC transporter permease [Leptotrichia sp. oral taxon 847]|uniref:metal ABC transporter permease n=1 Tax=Leptotrichia sp. oral taxon 847 TaxID=1785996 RepID=UPI00076810C0|nr:zinc ABC transporter permease [Leptotrichia sp. oral taxon 847]